MRVTNEVIFSNASAQVGNGNKVGRRKKSFQSLHSTQEKNKQTTNNKREDTGGEAIPSYLPSASIGDWTATVCVWWMPLVAWEREQNFTPRDKRLCNTLMWRRERERERDDRHKANDATADSIKESAPVVISRCETHRHTDKKRKTKEEGRHFSTTVPPPAAAAHRLTLYFEKDSFLVASQVRFDSSGMPQQQTRRRRRRGGRKLATLHQLFAYFKLSLIPKKGK